MTKVALINPGLRKILGTKKLSSIGEVAKAPLGLGFLASYLEKNGIEVFIVDEMAGDNVENKLKNINPDLIGLTSMTMFVPEAYRIAKWVKNNFDVPLIMGGVHATALPEEVIKHVDTVVVGEAEKVLLEMAKNPSKIKKGIIQGQTIENIDEIGMPARHLMNMKFYLSQKDQIAGIEMKAESIITSRGCPYRCIFCRNSLRPEPVRFNSVDHVINEIKYLKEKYGIEGLAFTDECFTANKPRLIEICKRMIKDKIEIKWECQTRSNLIDLDLVKLMKEAGCIQIGIGFESGSDRILKVLNKGNTVEQNTKAIKICKEAGMRLRGCFMIGNPTETKEDINLTKKFIEENNIDFCGVFLTTPYPGTELWNYALRNNLIPKDLDWSKFTTGSEVIPFANNIITVEELKRIHNEINMKCNLRNYSFSHLIKRAIKHPATATGILIKYIKGKL
ncbi:MAG: radical SAM protein [Candidatus Aenigmatarchaeota archaeon]